MKKIPLFLLTVHGLLIACAQPDVMITYASDFNKGYRIVASNNSMVSQTVELSFTSLSGYRSSKGELFRADLPAKCLGCDICRLTLFPNADDHKFGYTFRSFKGINVRNPDSNFAYLLPATAGKETRAFHVSYLGEMLGKDKPGFYAAGFTYKLGDTICAARAGTVYETGDSAEKRIKDEYYNERTHNYIHIEQPDGTLAQYTIAAPIKLLVREGDRVIPGQPLAVFSAADFNYPLIFQVYYLNLRNLPTIQDNYYAMVRTVFCVGQNEVRLVEDNENYTAIRPDGIVSREMTKKEMKKWGFKK